MYMSRLIGVSIILYNHCEYHHHLHYYSTLHICVDDIAPSEPQTNSKPNSRNGNMTMSRQQSRGSQVCIYVYLRNFTLKY